MDQVSLRGSPTYHQQRLLVHRNLYLQSYLATYFGIPSTTSVDIIKAIITQQIKAPNIPPKLLDLKSPTMLAQALLKTLVCFLELLGAMLVFAASGLVSSTNRYQTAFLFPLSYQNITNSSHSHSTY